MNRMLIAAALAVAALATQAVPALASEGIPGATVRSDSGTTPADRKARFEQWCQDNPEKCREVKAKAELSGRRDIGALRLRTVAAKDQACADFPDKGADGKPHPAVVLDLDYWVFMPR